MIMIRRVVLVLIVCGFVQAGYVKAERELKETMKAEDANTTISAADKPVESMSYDLLLQALSTMTVRNLNDQAVALEALWEERRVVLVFLRHFGWLFARQQVAALMDAKEQLDDMGVTVVAIGSGNPEQARMFIEKLGFEGEMYLDPSLSVYRAFGLKRGLWRTLGPSSVVRGVKALVKGFRQGGTAGDRWQQGGIFVIGPGNRLLFQHRNKSAGDNANMNYVLLASALPQD